MTAGSAGNHAQAMAFAAHHRGVPCEIFVPGGASISKVESCRAFGAVVHEVGATISEALAAARPGPRRRGWRSVIRSTIRSWSPAKGTLGLELVDDIDDLALRDRAARRRRAGVGRGDRGQVVATGRARGRRPGRRVRPVRRRAARRRTGGHARRRHRRQASRRRSPGRSWRQWVDEIVTVDEDTIADAMVLLMERAKLYVEGAGAVGVAALMSGAVAAAPRRHDVRRAVGRQRRSRRRAGLIRRHETQAGRRLTVFVQDRRSTRRPGPPAGDLRRRSAPTCSRSSTSGRGCSARPRDRGAGIVRGQRP